MDLTRKNAPSGRANSPNWIDISDLVPEEQKLGRPYLIGNIDHAIATLVVERPEIEKAVNFYNGERDLAEHAFLTDNFGVGTPADITFVPLIRQHIKVLLGILATNPLDYRVTCTDDATVDAIRHEKARAFAREVSALVLPALRARMQELAALGPQGQQAAQAVELAELERLADYYENDWQSEFERAAYNVSQHHIQDKDLRLRFAEIAEDLFVSGGCFYRVINHGPGQEPEYMAVRHQDLFFRKSTRSRFVKSCQRVVHRTRMTVQEVVNRFGHEMSPHDLRKLCGNDQRPNLYSAEIRHGSLIEHMANRWGESAYQGLDPNDSVWVYHVEWIANNRIDAGAVERAVEGPGEARSYRYRQDRYEGIRIGEGGENGIYLQMGKSRWVSRSVAQPWKCALSYNGVLYDDQNGKPYSLVLKTKPLQDRYDILFFHLDNAVARAGGKGVRVHVPSIPIEFGTNTEERILKYLAYLKEGVEIIDEVQEGSGKQGFNNYGVFDLSLDGRSMEGLLQAIKHVELTASNITGVNPPMLGQIAERQGLGTTNVAMQQGALSTKPYFLLLGEVMKASLSDLVNESRVAYSKGKKGSFLLGTGQREHFTVDPKKFSNSDFNIFFSDSGDESRALENLNALANKLVDLQMVDAEIAVDMATMKALGTGKRELKQAIRRAREKGLGGQAQQLAEAQQQLQELNAQLEALTKKNLDQEERRLAAEELRAQADAEYKRGTLANQQQKVGVEADIQQQHIDLERDELIFEGLGNKKEVDNKSAGR
jgi:hypothetical protein